MGILGAYFGVAAGRGAAQAVKEAKDGELRAMRGLANVARTAGAVLPHRPRPHAQDDGRQPGPPGTPRTRCPSATRPAKPSPLTPVRVTTREPAARTSSTPGLAARIRRTGPLGFVENAMIVPAASVAAVISNSESAGS